MSRIRASRTRGLVVWALIAGMLLPSITAVLGQPEAGVATEGLTRPFEPLSVLVFPLRDETGAGADLERIVTQALARALAQVADFEAEVFEMNSPSAVRQVEEGVLRTEDITPPYGPTSAVAVGHALEADVVLVGAILGRTYDAETNVVSLTISGTTYEVAANVDPETGTPKAELQAYRPPFGVTGSSVERTIPYRGPVADLDREAAEDAAQKAAARISGVAVIEKKVKKKTFWEKWGRVLVIALAVGGFALAASDGGEKQADKAPPPTSLAITRQNDGVRLSWGPPVDPPKDVFRYHVQRSVNNGPREDVGASGGLVLPQQFSLIDFDVQVGDRVEYFIRTKYVGNVNSPFRSFGTYIVSE
jgi:hypothetical protein